MKLSQTLYALILHLVPVRELHYINGADTLPAPLDPQQERQALEALSRGSTEARDLLITHNLRLVVYIAKKFETPSAGIEDMISIGTIGLIKAVNTFEPTKNIKLATYASRCIENEILMYLRKSSNRRQDASIDEPLNTDNDAAFEHHTGVVTAKAQAVAHGVLHLRCAALVGDIIKIQLGVGLL